MQQDLSVQQVDTLDAQLLREGWSLHQRLEAAIAASHPARSSAQLESWRQIVAPTAQPTSTNGSTGMAWIRVLPPGC